MKDKVKMLEGSISKEKKILLMKKTTAAHSHTQHSYEHRAWRKGKIILLIRIP